MKKTIATAFSLALASTAYAQVPTIDNANLKVAQETSKTTTDILDTNKEVLKTVEETLKAVTGDRGGVQSPMQNLAIGNGFSVSQMPSFDSLMSGGVPNFGNMGGDIGKIASTFINGLQLVKNLSGKADSTFSGDKSYEEVMNTVLGVAALVTGSNQAVQQRTQSFQQAGQQIGKAEDIKGSIDQNTQLQVQSGLVLNEMIGVMNGTVQSLNAQNQQRLVDMSNSKKAMTYGD
ncbi:conjugal transfer protein [Agrobacterium rosae]|uniref:type IV secretion system protein n=1 Tax=Agrobacterium rosae TaxID=1972867 RepID=UPI0019D34562|nr:type IV secretion system protein [Agrobacterium rosae]MBN7808998.1 conjugal transfer protein [Agrobacterium rosae]